MPQCDSSQTCTRAVWPKPSPADPLSGGLQVPRFPVLVHEVSRRAWGLRLRRTGQELALSLLPLTVAAQDSRPSRLLLLTCEALSSSTFMPVYPAHKNPYFTHNQNGSERKCLISTV